MRGGKMKLSSFQTLAWERERRDPLHYVSATELLAIKYFAKYEMILTSSRELIVDILEVLDNKNACCGLCSRGKRHFGGLRKSKPLKKNARVSSQLDIYKKLKPNDARKWRELLSKAGLGTIADTPMNLPFNCELKLINTDTARYRSQSSRRFFLLGTVKSFCCLHPNWKEWRENVAMFLNVARGSKEINGLTLSTRTKYGAMCVFIPIRILMVVSWLSKCQTTWLSYVLIGRLFYRPGNLSIALPYW